MARYTGPKSKIARELGEAIFGEDKVLARKNYAPGQHGANRRRKLSEYVLSFAKNKRINTPTVCSNVSSATFSRKLLLTRV